MELTGTYSFAATPSEVWSLLMDASAIAACLPGCRELRPIGDDRYQADLTIGVAAVSGAFAVNIALLDKVPPNSYRLNVEATGKPGFARGSAAIVLSPKEGGTAVAVTADAGSRWPHCTRRAAPPRRRGAHDHGPLLRVPRETAQRDLAVGILAS